MMPKQKKSAPQEGRIVEASLAAGVHASIGPGTISGIEQAMAAAVSRALREGVTDQAEIVRRKLAARDQVVADASRNVSGSRVIAAPDDAKASK